MENVPGRDATTIEAHEARVWAACIAATARSPGNPLAAAVDLSGATPLGTLAALNFSQYNRVVALGVDGPADASEIARMESFFAEHDQSRFLVEVTPVSQPADLVSELLGHGLADTGDRIVKTWVDLSQITAEPTTDVTELTVDDRDEWTAVNLASWSMPRFFAPWFGATLGEPGFRHFGVYDAGVLASVGAICVDGDLCWGGFSATRPGHRGRGHHQATRIKRLRVAAEMGCRLYHSESAIGRTGEASVSLRNDMRVGLSGYYEKVLYGPVGVGE